MYAFLPLKWEYFLFFESSKFVNWKSSGFGLLIEQNKISGDTALGSEQLRRADFMIHTDTF